MSSVHTQSPEETLLAGQQFSSTLRPGDIVALEGDLGSGKTLMVRGICQGLDVRDRVSSPTFTIVHEYHSATYLVVHIDLYRIDSRREVQELGLEEYFSSGALCLVEWPGMILDLLPESYYLVRLEHGTHEWERKIDIERISRKAA